ncbi:uncharacterized protein C8A04DRAFT_38679 [Dichotomopilus funicola]|uniref:Uncharacterized protein n=1 Tax=Dichotomopilus funicola TaxID=1934379 RepID=A0AAN6UZF4_9PEZI|nr:hypothetical protein C8A04DRAFT_38679 [Dichotomopilus funicola]
MADEDVGLNLAWAQTVGTFVGLLAIVFAVAAVLTERVRRVQASDERRFTSEESILGCFRAQGVSRWSSLWGDTTETLRLPTVAGLIEAGDRGSWTSSALDLMTENHPKETWVKLYESVMTSVVSNARLLGRDWKLEEEPVPSFLSRIEGGHHQEQHVASLWKVSQDLHQSRKLLGLHRGLERPFGVKEEPTTTAEPPSSEKTGLSRLTPTFIIRDKACIGVTREELAALIIIMGVAIPKLETFAYVWGVGGFGLSVDISHTDAAWCISIFQGLRLVRHAPSMGSGYTTLMAKHLACGSVPFAKNRSWILSVYLTDQVLDALKSGSCVIDKRAFGGDSLEFLRRLPGDKLVDAFYGTEDVAAFGTKFEPGSILHSTGELAGRWSRAITEIAFGGLVPQASPNVVSAVNSLGFYGSIG